MAITLFLKNKKPILGRCSDDYSTKMRLKYAPFYHAMDAQKGTTIRLDGREMIMLSSNDYLGLSFHPKVVEAGRAALLKWGTSTTGARPSNGSRTYHLELENKIAAFLGREACHIHAAGYLSCLSSVAAFAQKGDVILADKNVHSCLWAGIRLSHAPKMLVIEGVYSMEGHIARLPELTDIAEEHGCFTVLDDAHGFGVLGRQGRGTVDHFGLNDSVDVICGSLSKSLASTGGFVAASKDVIEFLRTHSKQTIFSAAISPSQAACARASLEVMQSEPQHLERLWSNTKKYRAMLKGLGFDLWESETPAVPIVLGSKERVYPFWKALLEKGIFTVMATSPAVPAGKDLIRTAVSAMHTDEQLEKIAAAMAFAAKKL